jgi:hypothetical protein
VRIRDIDAKGVTLTLTKPEADFIFIELPPRDVFAQEWWHKVIEPMDALAAEVEK